MILTGLALNINMFAQKGYAEKVNQLNSKGQKEGFWKEDLKYQITETYYYNGLKLGIFKAFSKKGELTCLGEYKNDTITGVWYHFGDFGHLIMIQKNFKKNSQPIPAEHHAQGSCPYQCYGISYYPNGVKKSEGILLWDESPESDFTFEYGEWKYYNDKGELIKTKIFK
jgi:antitoxin component YwqK of YwqJK toxin-antitoxin module